MATRASGYEPDPLGRFYTPTWVTDALFDALPQLLDMDGYVDCCAGDGRILQALEARGLGLLAGYDIAPAQQRVCRTRIARADALQLDDPFPAGRTLWITNPPYGHQGKLAREIIAHQIRLAMPEGAVAALLAVGFDARASRLDLFSGEAPFAHRVILTKRIRWANIEQQEAGPSQAHMWCVWDWRHLGPRPGIYV
jgi:hypothetical protein